MAEYLVGVYPRTIEHGFTSRTPDQPLHRGNQKENKQRIPTVVKARTGRKVSTGLANVR